MTGFLLNRAAQSIVSFWGAISIVFVIMHLSGDPTLLLVPEGATRADIEQLRHLLGFDRPLIVQYGDYLYQLARFDFGMSFYTWLYRIVVNLSIDALRKRSRLKPLAIDDIPGGLPAPPENEKPSDRIEGRETAERVRAVLAKLPEKYKTVMALRELDNLSCKEIAAIVRSTHATVRWRLHIARRMFKEHWERMERARREGRMP